MTPLRSRRAAVAVALAGLMSITAFASLGPSAATPGAAPAQPTPVLPFLGDPVDGPSDFVPDGTLAPTQAQRDAAAAIGVSSISWNALGTPSSLLPDDGLLADTGVSDPEAAARTWLADNTAVLGLSAAQVTDLELVSVQKLAQSSARAVLFQQRYDGLAPALRGLVTVGVNDGKVRYVSSSLSRDTSLDSVAPEDTEENGVDAWLAAAADLGIAPTGADLAGIVSNTGGGWTRLSVPGFAQQQQVRLRALPTADGVVPVFEANVVNVHGGAVTAFTSLVDADGNVLARHNKVKHHQGVFTFSGAITPTKCGPKHPFELPDGLTRTINVLVSGAPSDDFVVKLFNPGGSLIASEDLATNPEVLTYTAERIPSGTYTTQVCPFTPDSVVVGSYNAQVFTSDTAVTPPGTDVNPRWTFFTGIPKFSSTLDESVPTNVSTLCWTDDAGCDDTLKNIAAVGPWDQLVASGGASHTTLGNNAITHEAWLSPLTPGGLAQAPYSATRDYPGVDFTDAWNNSACDPTQLVPGGNDINFVVGNLFASHNRMHDWSYYLGFTEENYNLQTENMGRGGAPGDPEIGNVQAAAIDSHVIDPSGEVTGRNNANQVTLQDGVPGITNQYLFQPLAGAFYAPCTDGSLDMGIVGHEYTHAISNRMVAGPDQDLTSEQAGAMGESWSDLDAGEYLFAHNYNNGGNPWAVGAYATGNTDVAIRNFAINRNPLNYSDYGFDHFGAEVHSDGEIWNGTQWSVRKALVNKYNERFPASNAALQRRCADATAGASPRAPRFCPGNRRWIQLVFDSFLLQADGATSMLGMRDAMLAADLLRFNGANQAVMWRAFAQRGMGANASATDGDDVDPVPGFASPKEPEVTVTFDAPAGGKVYIGRFEARVTPIADTIARTARANVVRMVPGRYEVLFVSPTRGFRRIPLNLARTTTRKTVTIKLGRNLASSDLGASVISATDGSVNTEDLIDGTERTNWGAVTDGPVDASHPSIAVDLVGGVQTVRTVGVSALLRPESEEDPNAVSRFTALRQFRLERCTSACRTSGAVWKRFYTSPRAAFPAARPRPVAPDLTMRFFDVPDSPAAAVRLVVLENQCSGFAGFAGELDNDPVTTTDCKAGSDRDEIVHVSELQVYASPQDRG
ncbi:M36 family metallopeptidase [Nocardioides antri]|uniref:Peptidase M36 n=1 Tax=Nocardioides antri TaxID=2607659 RepID=A0A5B1M899_9ACTN|nr:M36 family metallopeptidase [Nocardioides antri]KAA1428748.1 peptidase M36 [Nocardioides antri]